MSDLKSPKNASQCAAGTCQCGGVCGEKLSVQLIKTEKGPAREATMHGRPFLVVPAVLVRSQVLHNNLGRSYLPASEITEEWAEMWNGIPVLVGDHPRMRGEDVSGRTPALWEERQVGFIFNAKVEKVADGARLLAEVWLELNRAEAVVGYKPVLEAVQSGEVVELSTGFRTRIEESNGNHGGQSYDLVMHPIAPDHLVISTEMTGACSVRDGCGLGAQAQGGAVEPATKSSVWEKLGALFSAKPAKLSQEDHDALSIKRLLEEVRNLGPGATDSEKVKAIRDSLQEQLGSSSAEAIIADTMLEDQTVVFWWSTPMGPHPKGGEYFMSTFTYNDGKYKFSEPKTVRRMTTYEAVGNATNTGESTDTSGVVAAANSVPGTGKESTMSEITNKELAEQVASLVTAVQGLTAKVAAFEASAKSDPNPAIAGLKATVAEVMNEIKGMREVTTAAVQERERERKDLVRQLCGHFRVPFNEAELESKPLSELRALKQMAEGTHFTGRGGPQGGTPAGDEPRFAEPTSWDTKKKDGE